MPIFVQALFENASTEIVGLSLHHLQDGFEQLGILDPGLFGSFGKPRAFGPPTGSLSNLSRSICSTRGRYS